MRLFNELGNRFMGYIKNCPSQFALVFVTVTGFLLIGVSCCSHLAAKNSEFILKELTSFDKAITMVLKHEGHLAHLKGDKGGITSYGISYRFLQKLIKEDPSILDQIDADHHHALSRYDIEHLTLEEAKKLYKEEFWDKFRIGLIDYQPLATKFLDMTVNMGYEEGAKLLMRAFEKLYPNFGKSTIMYTIMHGINARHEDEKHNILVAFCSEAEEFYQALAEEHPAYEKFIHGWVSRVWDGVKK